MVASDMEVDSLEKYRSRPRQLARWLLESRDTLRAKYQGLKVELNRLKVRVRIVQEITSATSHVGVGNRCVVQVG